MATALTGRTIAGSYKDLLQVYNGNQGIDSTLRRISDGEGTDGSALISTNKFQVRPASNGTDTFEVVNSSGSVIFQINTTSNKVTLPSGVTIEGDGSALTGIVSTGTGGSSATGNLEVQADSDASGSGDIIFKIGTKEVARIPYSYASSLPTGVAGNYFIKTIADNWGNPKGGARLDGVDDNYTMTEDNKLTSDKFSVEAFVKFKSTAESHICQAQTFAVAGWRFYKVATANTIAFGASQDGGTFAATSTNAVELEKWYHLIGTYDGTTGKLYANSVGWASGVGTYIPPTTENLEIGRRSTVYSNMEVGFVRIYSRALTASEVTKLYNNGRPDLAELDYADKGASNTKIYQSNFSSDVDSWVINTNDDTSALTWDTDHINLAVTGVGTNSIYPRVLRTNFVTWANYKDKKFRVTLSYNVISGTCVLKNFRAGVNGNSLALNKTLTGSGTYTFEYTLTTVPTSSITSAFFDFDGTNLFSIDIDDININSIGCVAEYKGENFGAMGLIDSSGNGLHGTSSGNPIALSKKKDYYKTVSTTAVQLVNTQKAGTILKQVKIKNITGSALTASLSTLNTLIATTSANNTLLNAVSVGANETKIFNIGDSAYSYASALRSLYVISSVATSLEVTLIYEEIE